MAACRYGFYFLVLKVSLTSERSERVRDSWKKTHAGVTVTVIRYRKLRTNHIVGFVTVPACNLAFIVQFKISHRKTLLKI